MSARCVYQSLLTCGITLPHQSCKNFDSTRVLPPVRVICSGSLQEYGGSAARYFWKAIIECISSLRCAVCYAIYGGGRLSTSVLFLISVCESECRWLMAKQCCKPPLPFYRPRQAAACKTLYAPSLLYIEGRRRKVEISLQLSYVCENTPTM